MQGGEVASAAPGFGLTLHPVELGRLGTGSFNLPVGHPPIRCEFHRADMIMVPACGAVRKAGIGPKTALSTARQIFPGKCRGIAVHSASDRSRRGLRLPAASPEAKIVRDSRASASSGSADGRSPVAVRHWRGAPICPAAHLFLASPHRKATRREARPPLPEPVFAAPRPTPGTRAARLMIGRPVVRAPASRTDPSRIAIELKPRAAPAAAGGVRQTVAKHNIGEVSGARQAANPGIAPAAAAGMRAKKMASAAPGFGLTLFPLNSDASEPARSTFRRATHPSSASSIALT